MIYLEYVKLRAKYNEIQNIYNEILSEKENLFTRTQPNAIRYDQEHVQGGSCESQFDAYLIAKEEKKIDERLSEARQFLEDREKLLLLKEKELRASKDRIDLVYVMRFLDNKRPYLIAKSLNYSESQIYRIIDKIQKSLRG